MCRRSLFLRDGISGGSGGGLQLQLFISIGGLNSGGSFGFSLNFGFFVLLSTLHTADKEFHNAPQNEQGSEQDQHTDEGDEQRVADDMRFDSVNDSGFGSGFCHGFSDNFCNCFLGRLK